MKNVGGTMSNVHQWKFCDGNMIIVYISMDNASGTMIISYDIVKKPWEKFIKVWIFGGGNLNTLYKPWREVVEPCALLTKPWMLKEYWTFLLG